MTFEQCMDAVMRGETSEQYKKRLARIKRLANERDDLEDAIEILGEDPRAEKKRQRLNKVLKMIEALQ